MAKSRACLGTQRGGSSGRRKHTYINDRNLIGGFRSPILDEMIFQVDYKLLDYFNDFKTSLLEAKEFKEQTFAYFEENDLLTIWFVIFPTGPWFGRDLDVSSWR